MTTQPECKRCKSSHNVKLRKQYAASGAIQIMWYCLSCDRVADSQNAFISKSTVQYWIKSGKLKLSNIEDIPTAHDYRETAVCAVCGQPGAEYHHWLPQAFADDVENHSQWPGAYLCKKHHDEWHEIVTPYLPGRGASEQARHTLERYKDRWTLTRNIK